ncbi:hypothetical protein OJ997_29130 [Solirubrobacter phytolaccae]|uniref:Uncharacterized protein n=1 Tax=Solirubrobacter phytolaccae TaxID=1404360 RepID=A0A9X3NDE8_9ACTN|nr:hypothetical protein [Solirubrobacter phytolaccae]MDA0184403.1 hypothetical protein [Solirubrobacter phytolaccae]
MSDRTARSDVKANPRSDLPDCGVCAGDVPPLIGQILTGTGLTLAQAAELLASGDALHGLTSVQRRIVEEYVERS